MGKLEVVHGRARDWTPEQVAMVNAGIEATQGTVPHIEGSFDSFLVLDGDKPIGIFTVIPTGREDAIEIGVRFWERRMQAGFVMARALHTLFDMVSFVIARCYANNMAVRHLLQRAGFILLNIDKQDGRTVHMYGCRKEDFERLSPLKDRHGG